MAAAEDRELALESPKTRRVREKLLKAWSEEKAHFTPEALKKTAGRIRKWIADNAGHRVPVKKKDIHLFDTNRNAADSSKKVQLIAAKMRAIVDEKPDLK